MTDTPRQPAYDAVFAYIRSQPRDFMPSTVVERNAMIWHAVHAALGAVTAVAGPDANTTTRHVGTSSVGESAITGDGLRERYAAAAEEAHLEWMRPGSDAGQRPLADYLADALAAVRDRRMEQLEAGRATWKRKAEEIERDRDRLAAELAAERRRAEQAEADVNHNAALSHDFRQRAEQAEAAIARVRATNLCGDCKINVRAALDGTASGGGACSEVANCDGQCCKTSPKGTSKAASDDGLREQYAAAVHKAVSRMSGIPDGVTAAVLKVRDDELARLRADLAEAQAAIERVRDITPYCDLSSASGLFRVVRLTDIEAALDGKAGRKDPPSRGPSPR